MLASAANNLGKMKLFDPSTASSTPGFSISNTLDMDGPRHFRYSAHDKSNLVAFISFNYAGVSLEDITRSNGDTRLARKYLWGAGNSILQIQIAPFLLCSRY